MEWLESPEVLTVEKAGNLYDIFVHKSAEEIRKTYVNSSMMQTKILPVSLEEIFCNFRKADYYTSLNQMRGEQDYE